jgi:hypothetical protein
MAIPPKFISSLLSDRAERLIAPAARRVDPGFEYWATVSDYRNPPAPSQD